MENFEDIFQLRRINLNVALNEKGRGSAAALAKALNHKSPSMVSRWRTVPRDGLVRPEYRIHEEAARAIEAHLSLSTGWLDIDHTPERTQPPAQKAAGAPPVDTGVPPTDIATWMNQVQKMTEGHDISFDKFSTLFEMAYKDALEHGNKLRPDFVRGLIGLMK